jgi:hypothetical protein
MIEIILNDPKQEALAASHREVNLTKVSQFLDSMREEFYAKVKSGNMETILLHLAPNNLL